MRTSRDQLLSYTLTNRLKINSVHAQREHTVEYMYSMLFGFCPNNVKFAKERDCIDIITVSAYE